MSNSLPAAQPPLYKTKSVVVVAPSSSLKTNQNAEAETTFHSHTTILELFVATLIYGLLPTNPAGMSNLFNL